MSTIVLFRCSISILPFALAASASAVTYTFTDLGPIAGYDASAAYAISPTGQVGGASLQGFSLPNATIWNSSGTPTSLGFLPGGTFSRINALNGSGQAAGYANSTDGPRAFLYNPGTGMQSLGVLPGKINSYGNALNASGTVAGTSGENNSGNVGNQAFRWTAAGGMEGLVGPTRFALTSATGINSSGQVVGNSTGNGPNQGCFWDVDGTLTTISGYAYVGASAVNDAGQVTGFLSNDNSTFIPYVWTKGGGFTELGRLPGHTEAFGYSINAAGTVVGNSSIRFSAPTSRAFIWTPQSGMVDLNSLATPTFADNVPNFIMTNATGINDAGQIVGYGTSYGIGAPRAFLLTPQAVPEPASLAALGLAALPLLRRRRIG